MEPKRYFLNYYQDCVVIEMYNFTNEDIDAIEMQMKHVGAYRISTSPPNDYQVSCVDRYSYRPTSGSAQPINTTSPTSDKKTDAGEYRVGNNRRGPRTMPARRWGQRW